MFSAVPLLLFGGISVSGDFVSGDMAESEKQNKNGADLLHEPEVFFKSLRGDFGGLYPEKTEDMAGC